MAGYISGEGSKPVAPKKVKKADVPKKMKEGTTTAQFWRKKK